MEHGLKLFRKEHCHGMSEVCRRKFSLNKQSDKIRKQQTDSFMFIFFPSTFALTQPITLSLFTFMHWRRKWQPTPVFQPGESPGRGSLVGCRLWGRTELDTTKATVAAAANHKLKLSCAESYLKRVLFYLEDSPKDQSIQTVSLR